MFNNYIYRWPTSKMIQDLRRPLFRNIKRYLLDQYTMDVEDVVILSTHQYIHSTLYDAARPLGFDYEVMLKIHPPSVFYLMSHGCAYVRMGTSQARTQIYSPEVDAEWIATETFNEWSGYACNDFEQSALTQLYEKPEAKLLEQVLQRGEISEDDLTFIARALQVPAMVNGPSLEEISEEDYDTVVAKRWSTVLI